MLFRSLFLNYTRFWMILNIIKFVVLSFFINTTLADFAISETDPDNGRIFSSDSFWYKPIPEHVALHPNSANFVSEFIRQKATYYGNVAINAEKYASPVYVVDSETPLVSVEQWNCQDKKNLDSGLRTQWADVPIPLYAIPAGGSDAEMTIYQPGIDKIWEFWKSRKIDGQWQACWGGAMENVSKNDGRWPGFYGTTATGLPFLGGQITAEELKRGEIKHVIGISLVDLEDRKLFSWPAKRSDGYNPNSEANRIPEGLRFRLDPSLDLDNIKLHPIARIVAKAAQVYGFVVWDKSGGISIRLQNPYSYLQVGQADPYVEMFAGTPRYAILTGIPWERLQFLPIDYGKP